jgi:type IV fimbrial biogenesis protein FimT
MDAKLIRGFTLWELMTSLAVIGILLGIGVPSLMELQRNMAITSAANDLVSALLAARAEAVKRQVPVTVCASPNPLAAAPACSPTGAGTNGGFVVWVDENGNLDGNGAPILTDASDGNAVVDGGETVLIARPAPGGVINVFGDSGYISYGANGFRRDVPGLNVAANDVLYCDDRGNRPAAGNASTARVVRIDALGRGQVLRTVNEITPVVAALGAACP